MAGAHEDIPDLKGQSNAPRRIAVLVGTSLLWRQLLLRGIARFSAGSWQIYSAPEGSEESLFFTSRYSFDGLIVRVASEHLARRIKALGTPVVSVGSLRAARVKLPQVKAHEPRMAGDALSHLRSQGLRDFAFCGYLTGPTRETRGGAFLAAVRQAGFPAAADYRQFSRLKPECRWQERQRELVRWVKTLPRPVGLWAWSPDVACQVLDACRIAGLKVPEEVAILSAGEDPLKLELSTPGISSLELPAEEMGFQAAQLLEKLIGGEPPPQQPVEVIPSRTLHWRGSTQVADPMQADLREAQAWLDTHWNDAVPIAELLRGMGLSRRSLERHFERVMGLSPHEYRLRKRLDQARQYLLETPWPIARVGRACGMANASYFARFFTRHTGLTPQSFRQQNR